MTAGSSSRSAGAYLQSEVPASKKTLGVFEEAFSEAFPLGVSPEGGASEEGGRSRKKSDEEKSGEKNSESRGAGTQRPEYARAARRLLAHLWHCRSSAIYEPVRLLFAPPQTDPGVPISHKLLSSLEGVSKNRTQRVWRPLEEAGLIEVTEQEWHGRGDLRNRSRTYRLSQPVLRTLEATISPERKSEKQYDLITGEPVRRKQSTKLTYRSRGGTPQGFENKSPFMKSVLKALKGQRDLINREAVLAHLERLRGRSETHLSILKEKVAGLPGLEKEITYEQVLQYRKEGFPEQVRKLRAETQTGEMVRSTGRYRNDDRIWDQIQHQNLRPAPDQPDGIYQYETAYAVQLKSGRLTMRAGLQNATTEMKAAAAKGIPRYRNYDIISSQTEALRQEFEEAIEEGASLDIGVLENYPGKDALAEKHSIDRELWKRPEHAVKFGASFPFPSYEVGRNAQTEGRTFVMIEIAEAWAETSSVPLGSPEEVYALLKEVYGPMSEEIEQWRTWLLEKHWEANKQPGGARGPLVRNPCGLPFRPRGSETHESSETRKSEETRESEGTRESSETRESEGTRESSETRGSEGSSTESGLDGDRYRQKVDYATSRLQGLEARYIHELTLMGKEYDYEFLRNEHDGAVVLGEIPEEAREEARKRSGFRKARLSEKEFE